MVADTQHPVNQIFTSVFYLSVLEGSCDFWLLLVQGTECLLLEGSFEWWCAFFSGWQWSPSDRPSFAEIHQAFETMFQESSISDGRSSNSRGVERADCILNSACYRLLGSETRSCVILPGVNGVESSYLFTCGYFFLSKHLILKGQMAEQPQGSPVLCCLLFFCAANSKQSNSSFIFS